MTTIISCVLVLTACEKPPAAEAEPAPPAVVATSKDIVGKWKIHSGDLRDAAYNMIKNQVEARDLPVDDQEIERHVDEVADIYRKTPPIYRFDEDNTMTLQAGEVTIKGKWAIDGDTVTITPDDDDREIRFRYEPGFLRLIPRREWGRVISLVPAG